MPEKKSDPKISGELSWAALILDCFYFKIVLNTVSTIGFTNKLNALNFEENDQTLLIKANTHIEIVRASTAQEYQYFI